LAVKDRLAGMYEKCKRIFLIFNGDGKIR
jgi:hypothetical protein